VKLIDLYKGISDFKKAYQPRNKVVKDGKDDLITDSHSILPRWRKHFSQQLNIYRINDVRQTEIYTAQPLLPEPSAFGVEMAIEELKRHKLPGIVQIQQSWLKKGLEQFALRYIHLLILFGIKRIA